MPTNTPETYIVITQYQENYGAHDWDSSSETDCPQHWKFKGGFDYYCEGFESKKLAAEAVKGYCCNNNYSKESPVQIYTLSEWIDAHLKGQSLQDLRRIINDVRLMRVEIEQVQTSTIAYYHSESIPNG